jgi:O-antigen ligase
MPAAPVPVQSAAPRFLSLLDETTPQQRLFLYFALGLVFVQTTFLHEIIAIRLGIRSFLPPIFGSIALLGVFATGGVNRIFRHKAAFFYVACCLLIGISTPFSSWPGNSIQTYLTFIRTQASLFVVIAGLVVTPRDFLITLYTLATAGIVNELSGFFMQQTQGNRLGVEVVTIGNANDFAAHLLFLLPFFMFVSLSKTAPKLVRLLMLGAAVYGLYLILLSGSRGALVALAAGYVFLLFRAQGAVRFGMAAALPIVFVAVIVVLPSQVRSRLLTLVSSEQSVDTSREAALSAQSRSYLLFQSLRVTLEHPLFGVGLGEFKDVEGSSAQAEGRRGVWGDTHNSFTQVASETGIPSFLLLILALGSSLFSVANIYRQARNLKNVMIERFALAVFLSLITFSVSAFFLSLGYRFYWPTLIGLSIALTSIAKAEFSRPLLPTSPVLPVAPPWRPARPTLR